MPSESTNKRIAKNTLLLYVRILLTMVIGLYTSRVVLAELGISGLWLIQCSRRHRNDVYFHQWIVECWYTAFLDI